MRNKAFILPLIAVAFLLAPLLAARAQTTQPFGKLPHLEIDVKNKTVKMECEVCNAEYGLEFFCVAANTNEYESVLSSKAKASDLHAALLMLGLKPGEPVKYSESTKKWAPPHGPPLQITAEFDKDGKHQSVPAYRLMRNVKSKKEVAPMTWVFAGSKVMEDKNYAADVTGYLISVLNNELTVIDIPALAGTALETREWEPNRDLLPARGTKVFLVIEPAGKEVMPALDAPKAADGGASADVASRMLGTNGGIADITTQPSTQPLDDVQVDQARIDHLKAFWAKKVGPHSMALREAAQAHYEVIEQLRREQQRLIDESDRINRVIDQLEKQYQDMTTPHPE